MKKIFKTMAVVALATSTMISSASAFCVYNKYGKDIHIVFTRNDMAKGESLTNMSGTDRMIRYLRAQKGGVIFKDLVTLGVNVGVAAGKAAIAAETGMGAQDAGKAAASTAAGAVTTVTTTASNVEDVINLKKLPKAGDEIFMSHGGIQSAVTAASRGTNKIKWNKTIKDNEEKACWNWKEVVSELGIKESTDLLFFITERQTTTLSPVLYSGTIKPGGFIVVDKTAATGYNANSSVVSSQKYQ